MKTPSVRRAVNPRRGFTLIELLVVVAIIALLLSILLPSLERARAQARQVLDLTNLRAQGQATFNYAEENDEYMGRGIMWTGGGDEYNIYASTVLPYLGFNGHAFPLYRAKTGKGRPSAIEQRRIRRALADVGDQLQCPDFPDEAHKVSYGGPGAPTTQTLDYVASAMPVPYDKPFYDWDLGLNDKAGKEPEFTPQGPPISSYVKHSRLTRMAAKVNPSRFVYVTEAHVSLRWNDFAYHHFFSVSHLPFGKFPRIANDQRHPGGITSLFFDGHATVMSLTTMDVGWPNTLAVRLKWLTQIPREFIN